jgi:hypothetical protein
MYKVLSDVLAMPGMRICKCPSQESTTMTIKEAGGHVAICVQQEITSGVEMLCTRLSYIQMYVHSIHG